MSRGDWVLTLLAAIMWAVIAGLILLALSMIMGCDSTPEIIGPVARYSKKTTTDYPDGKKEVKEEESVVTGPVLKGTPPKSGLFGAMYAGPDGAKGDPSKIKGQKPPKKLTSLSGIYYASAGVMVLGAVMCKLGGLSVGIPIILAGLGIAAAFRFMETYPWVLAVAACGAAVAVGPALWRSYRAKTAEATNRDLVSAIAHADKPHAEAIKDILDKKTGKAAARLRSTVGRAKKHLNIS